MLNPEIIEKSCVYKTQESCLSLVGGPRPAVRYKKITVKYYTTDFKYHQETFDGFTAQIIQHEIDHCEGVLI
jgi:peptide deformylase